MRSHRLIQWMGIRFVRATVTGGCLAVAMAAAGCSDLDATGAGGGRETGWTPMRLPGVSRDAAIEAGVYAMGQWFRLADDTSPSDGIIQSVREEYEQAGGTGRLRDGTIGYKNRMRREATLVIRERETGCLARCRVRVQRLDTSDHRIFRRNEQFGDVPSETPIDRDAGVSARQNQVWTDMPRDRELERNILALLRSRVTGEGAE